MGTRPAFLKNRVAYYVAGANGDAWRYADSLEAVAPERRNYFLNSVGGRAGDAFGGGRLDRTTAVRSDPDTWIYNPLACFIHIVSAQHARLITTVIFFFCCIIHTLSKYFLNTVCIVFFTWLRNVKAKILPHFHVAFFW